MIDAELGTRVDLELMLEDEADCEWPNHWMDMGVLGKHHTDTGAMWLLTLVCPCGESGTKVKVCDGAHRRVMRAVNLEEPSIFMDCHHCGKHRTASESYVSSTRFG